MARLLSVNVGLPRDIAWKGRTVRTGLPDDTVCIGDRFQIESYRYWQEQLSRSDFIDGQFGDKDSTVLSQPMRDVVIDL